MTNSLEAAEGNEEGANLHVPAWRCFLWKRLLGSPHQGTEVGVP